MIGDEKAQMLSIVDSIILDNTNDKKSSKKVTNTIKLKAIDQSSYKARSPSSSNSKKWAGSDSSNTPRSFNKFKYEKKQNDALSFQDDDSMSHFSTKSGNSSKSSSMGTADDGSYNKKRPKDKPSLNWVQYLKKQKPDSNPQLAKKNGEKGQKLTPFAPIQGESKGLTPFVALDCEMVMVEGNIHELARCSIVNYNGYVLFDKFIKPKRRITNFLTWVSGVTPAKIKNSPTYDEVKDEILGILANKKIVGHSLKNDFEALGYYPEEHNIRDLAHYRQIRNQGKILSLKKMCDQLLNFTIQEGQHDSVIDARSAMAVYRKYEQPWEDELKHNNYQNITNLLISDLANGLQ